MPPIPDATRLRRLPIKVNIATSAGVASAPGDGVLALDLVRAADARLYRAKAAGGNRVIA